MAWVLSKMSLPDDWEKAFATEAEAVDELLLHICNECLAGELKYIDAEQPAGFGVEIRKKPDPSSATDLLSTSCGCEFELHEDAD